MDLRAYLDRIRFTGPARPDLATLRAVHRAHQYAVPFENLDVQLKRPVTLDLEASYDKIVRRGRGGWCYEMNCVMGWALREIGFDVMRMGGGVMREQIGDVQLGNHLCLRVRLDQPYLVDVGFGGSLSEPMPLAAVSSFEDRPYRHSLSETSDGYWRFAERALGDPFSFDFRAVPADEALFAAKCRHLQTDAASPFVQNLVVQRRSGDMHYSLRGRVLITLESTREDKRLLSSADELVATLRERFDLEVPEAATLWPAICARHEAVFGKEGAGPQS
ncbi:MAG TPA: arylamine N-acetyltransferase [Steroidobacteraceae bacterium]|jgi:N-hydroxyarylamine O-acetyltransferase|nr:arylamine N-acetyltransferase [Steroidobacteraceae bacterium]